MPGLKLVAELGGDGSGFDAMMRRASGAKDKFATAFTGLKGVIASAFTVGAITSFVRNTLEAADNISDMAQQLQISTDEVQRLDIAADRAGKTLESVQSALGKLGVARRAAAEKDDDLLKTFEKFGVTMADLQNPAIRNLDILRKMADASKTLVLSNRDLTDLGDIFGQRMQGIFAVMEEMHQLGPVRIIDKDTIDELKRAEEILKDVKRDAQGIGAKFLATQVTGAKLGVEFLKRMLGITSAEDMITNMERAVSGTTVADMFGKALTGLVTDALGGGKKPDTGPLFEDKREDKETTVRSLRRTQPPALITDALVGVGNFLGRNPALVNDINAQQLHIARQQLDIQKQMLAQMRAANSPSAMTLEVPAL